MLQLHHNTVWALFVWVEVKTSGWLMVYRDVANKLRLDIANELCAPQAAYLVTVFLGNKTA